MSRKMDVHFSSKTDDHATPQHFFDELNSVFRFTLDPCASDNNAKCDTYFTKEDNGLMQSWAGHVVFMNPPYGRGIAAWVAKARFEAIRNNVCTVALLPARTDTGWWHQYCKDYLHKFIQGRLVFGDAKNSAPFPSVLVYFGPLFSLHGSIGRDAKNSRTAVIKKLKKRRLKIK